VHNTTSAMQRCAIYARFSSDMQRDTSIDDQIRKCREYAEGKGWEIVEAFVLHDSAVSAASMRGRGALQTLVEAAKRRPRPFDRILIDDSSRLSRNVSDSLNITAILKFNEVFVTSISQGIDSQQQTSRQLLTLHGMMDEQFLIGLADKVHRGQEGRALQGLVTGGRCYGYKNVPIEDPTRLGKYGRPVVTGVRGEVVEEQANVVRRIFEMSASGYSLAQIVKTLNSEGIESPQPARGRQVRAWVLSSVREMLFNERYRGVLVWNRTRKQLNPETGRKVSKARPQSEWKRIEAPVLRIVPEELWNQVHRGLGERRRVFGNGASHGLLKSVTSKYLFSGLLICGCCGARLVIVAGGVPGYAKYGCPSHRYRGICDNKLTIRVDRLEEQLVGYLEQRILTDEMAEYTVQIFEKELKSQVENLAKENSAHRANINSLVSERAQLNEEAKRIVNAIASAGHSRAMLAALAEIESKVARLDHFIEAKKAPPISVSSARVREFALAAINDLRTLLKTSTQRAKAKLTTHVERLVLTPTDTLEGKAFKVEGQWRLLPEEGCVILMVARDGIEPPTPAFSGLRSTS
jgi:site-specific DNA recombinase